MIEQVFELLSLSSYILAGFYKSELKSTEAAMKYFILGAVSSGTPGIGDTEQLMPCISRLRNVESVFDVYRITPAG